MNLEDALKKIPIGKSVLFTGAGFSIGSTNIKDQSPMSGKYLTDLLYKKCGILDGDGNLNSAAELYVDSQGKHSLIELLKEEYTIMNISESQKYIGSLPWKRIYTTNYDEVIETSYKLNKKLITPVTLDDKIDYYKDKRALCIHLNGFIGRLNPNTLSNEFKLTTTSYLTADFVKSRWIDFFKNDFESSHAVFFIGFSMNADLDLSRIISSYKNRDHIFFIVGENESELNVKRIEKFGTVLKIGLNGFVERLKEVMVDFIPPEDDKISNIISFKKVELNHDNVPKLKDIDAYDLFFMGNYKDELLHFSLLNSEKFKYYLKREKLESVIEYIKGGGNNLLIHSDLGNGKTLFIAGLMNLLTKLDYQVFKFNKYYDSTSEEIEFICNLNKSVLVVENYASNHDLLKRINLHRTDETVVIVSERSIINDTHYGYLSKILFEKDYKTIDLNNLNDTEISTLVDITTSYGFWGKDSGLSKFQMERVIRVDCLGSFRLFLLKFLNSSNIKDKFNKILNDIREINDSFFEAVLLILFSNYFGFRLEFDDLVDILDDELISNPSFYNNDHLLEIIDFNDYKIKTKSSILSEALLENNIYRDDLIPILVKVMKRLDERRFDKNIHDILKKMVSFSRLQSLFSLEINAKFKSNVIQFYEEVKNIEFAKKNPFFWLQYAIARLSTRNYDISQKYFDTAYSLAKSIDGFDTYQIDNHYARHIIENEIINGTIETCMEQFMKAHKMLNNFGDTDKNKQYPIRVATNYGKFHTMFYDNLEEGDKKLFLLSCKEILFRISEYKSDVEVSRRPEVIDLCERILTRIIDKEEGVKRNQALN